MRARAVTALVLLAFGAAQARAGESVLALSPRGVGSVRIGLPRAEAMKELTALLGQPDRGVFTNSGCGPAFSEVGWRHLYAEFSRGKFSGFRYIEYGWPVSRLGARRVRSDLPRLATPNGITLGSTLGELRAAYRHVRPIGTDRWLTSGGLVFYDNATTYPDPPSSRIIEIKLGTCGDF